jgi:lipoprotein LprG
VNGKTYAKNSLLLPDWTEIDPATYGAPDPAKLMDPDGGFSGLLSAAEDVKQGDTVRGGKDNKEVLTEYTGTIASDAVSALIPSAEGDFDFTYAISKDDELRQAVLKGAFYGKDHGDLTYTLNLDDYGTVKDIQAP